MKIVRWLVALLFLISIFPCAVSAESIADYRAKIKEFEAEQAEIDKKSAAVQDRIDKANARIDEISRQISDARKQQDETKNDIDRLGKEIKNKEEEIKELVAFYQISDSDNFYLKFVFGADSFEDFIYRFSVAEQLTDANDKLVDEMNALIKENKEKVKELESQEKNLRKLDSEIQKEIAKLGKKKRDLTEDVLSADEEISYLEKQIAIYKKAGCSETEDVSSCTTAAPSSNGFIIPTASGVIENDGASEYGWRWHPVKGGNTFHDGIDLTASWGTNVYAASSGVVKYAGDLWGFGNAIMIVHNVNGQNYTSLYGHLSSINVGYDQIVQRGDIIGLVGSTGVSSGPHLHFQMMVGSGYSTNTVNPRQFVNFPSAGVYW